jgi:uncharacterized protein YciI
MPVYSAIVDVVVHRSYTVVLTSGDALDEAGGVEQIRHLAQTLTQQEIEALIDRDPTRHALDNVYTEVVAVREPEEETPDEEEVVLDRIRHEDAADAEWGAYAADDPEGAEAALHDLADQDDRYRKDEQAQREPEEGRL